MNNILETFLISRKMEYLVIDANFTIIEKSDNIERLAESPAAVGIGCDIRDAFPELYGTEEVLLSILDQALDHFDIPGIARESANGQLMYLHLSFLPYITANDQQSRSLFLFCEEITENMLMQQKLVQSSNETNLLLAALSASKNYIDRVLSHMADALIVTNCQGIIKTANQAAQKLFSYEENELLDKNIALIIQDHDFLDQVLSHLSLGEIFSDLEIICRNQLGQKLFVEFSCSVVSDQSDIKNLIFIGRDVTQRLRDAMLMQVQYTTAKVLSNSHSMAEAISQILSGMAENLGAIYGELWMPAGNMSDGIYHLTCLDTWYHRTSNLENLSRQRQNLYVLPGEKLVGKIWLQHLPIWWSDLSEYEEFTELPSQEFSPQMIDQLITAFGFPIKDGEEILGVMTFFSPMRQPADPELMQVMGVVGSQIGQFMKRKQAEKYLLLEQEKTEKLLLNILPEKIAAELKQKHQTIAEDYAHATVLFADIVGFTQLASSLSPIELVELLNQIFSSFDLLTEKYGLEKIKTIGDAYMVVGGLPIPRIDHAEAIARMALDMLTALKQFNENHHRNFSIRIGIHSGPVVAGVIGIKKFIYDLWGDTVNIASRMESHGIAGKIQVSHATYLLLKNRFHLQTRGKIAIKGRGEMTTHILLREKSSEEQIDHLNTIQSESDHLLGSSLYSNN
jgi:PAS domain S-box-containing protein